MRAARLYGTRDIRVEDVTLPPLKSDEVEIKIAWCGICGSDRHMYERPAGPFFKEPFIMGHEFSGTVQRTGEEVKKIKTGDRVVVNPLYVCHSCYACLHGHPNLCENIVLFGCGPALDGAYAEYTQVPEYTVHKIPDNLPLDKAAIVEPASIALHSLRVSRFKAGDDAAVFGAGPLGLLLVQELKQAGAKRVFMVAHSEARRALAKKFGADVVLDPDKDEVVKTVKELSNGGVQVTYDMAGADQTLQMGLEVLHARGELIMAALPADKLALNVYALINGERTIKASTCTNDEFPMVAQLISEGRINVDDTITKKIFLDDIAKEGFEALENDKSQLKILITAHKEYLEQ
jgi:(R,R)-butanediol dehydrogenase/meso-butanediol dehydrogenase/diacetyl reductase